MTMTTKPASLDIERKISFEMKELDFDAFKQTMDEYGVIICRNAYSIHALKKVRDLVFQQVFPKMKLGRDFRQDLEKFENFPKELKLKTLNFLLEGVVDMADLDRDKIFQMAAENSGIMPLIEQYVNKGPISSLISYYYARTVDPLELGYKLGFHQDGTFLRGLGDPEKFMICWNPLVSINGNAPGLELIAKSFDTIFETAQGEYHSVAMANQDELLEKYQDYLIQPNMRVGDFILFSPFTPHRTHLTEHMTDIRTSIDFRFFCGKQSELKNGKIASGY